VFAHGDTELSVKIAHYPINKASIL